MHASTSSDSGPDRLPLLRRRFLSRAHDRLAEMRSIAVGAGGGALSPIDRDILIRLAHQLAGTGGSYGLDGLSRAASRLEASLENEALSPDEVGRRLAEIEIALIETA